MKLRIMILCLLLGLSNAVWAEDPSKPPTLPAKQASSNAKPDAKSPADKAPERRGNDQLILDATVVSGNRELPKVMYIVPWKKAELGTLPGQPFNTLVDATLAPVDREVFQREVAYYEVVSSKDRAATITTADPQATSGADRK